jgi:hypothetical protein
LTKGVECDIINIENMKGGYIMNVITKSMPKVEFSELDGGEVFIYHGDYYMKTFDDFLYNDDEYNAVMLSDGDFNKISNSELVKRAHGEFTIWA